MIYKLRTSAETQEVFAKLGQLNGLQPYVLSKIAIALSIRKGRLNPEDYKTDNTGLELNRQTIFGDTDSIFRSLIFMNEGTTLEDEDYFPKTVKAHLDRGAHILGEEARYSKNFYVNLCQLDINL